ncbi:MAG: NYN domain-containing protein [Clostridiales bacterium]|nr:NYN domain-containing protein [Clostridiales bacterium]
MESKKFALLIDADNISAKYIAGILDEITKYGIATYKRIYGDWTSTQANKWKNELLGYSIVPIQQFSNTVGKNATDSALIIDAMDILYGGNVDGFCIVSSDSDFTRLASRLRESGMTVIGMGEDKTPQSFRSACSQFVSLENLLDEEDTSDGTITQSAIEATIVNIISENEDHGKQTGLGEIGSRLVNKYPDFDVRNYGYSYLSKYIEEIPRFKLSKSGTTIMVGLADNQVSKIKVKEFIEKTVAQSKREGIGLSELSNMVHREFPDFNLKDFGYSRFFKFVQSIRSIKVKEDGAKRKRAVLRK